MSGPDPSGEAPGGGAVPTGHPQVDLALAALAVVADAPPGEQVPALAQAHQVLRDTLDTIEDV